MSSKKKTPPEASARPTLATSRLTAAEIVTLTEQRSQVVSSSPGWANAPDVQKAVGVWGTAAGVVGADAQGIEKLKLELAALKAQQVKDVAAWKRATTGVLAAVGAASAGSPATIQGWGFTPLVRTPTAPLSEPPAGLRATYNKQLDLVLRWAGVRAHIGYFVQIGDGTPQGWGNPIACSKAQYAPPGLLPGAKIVVRVAVQRRSGMSSWSDALSLTVR